MCITGPAASGKSTICKFIVSKLNAIHIDADEEVKELYAEDKELERKIRRLFGSEVFYDGEVSRRVLARKIFYQPELRTLLEGLVYPELIKRIRNKIENSKEEYDVILVEAVKPIESGIIDICDRVVSVIVDRWTQLERLEGKGLPYSFCWALVLSQYRTYQYADLANCIVYNTGSIEELDEKSDYIVKRIQENNEPL